MSELDPFETRFAAAYRRYLAEAPVEADPVAVARRVAAAGPRHQGLAGFRPFGLTPALAWVLLLAGLLLALVVGGLAAGSWRPDQAVVIVPSPMFSPTGSMTTARIHHTATLLPDGRVLVTGGSGAQAPLGLASAEIYDPNTNTFSPTGSMTTARGSFTATLLADGRVLVAGGVEAGDDGSKYLASAEAYDPRTGTFGPTGSMATARGGHTATLLADGRVLVAGGDGLASAEIFDPTTGTFGPTGSMATARVGHAATLLADGRILVTGGRNGAQAPLDSAEIYDPKTGTFSPTASLTTAREGPTATLLADGCVLVAGGSVDQVGPDVGQFAVAAAEIYDPRTGTFGPTGSMATARERHTATLLADGRVLVAGGTRDFFGVTYASAELYDPATGRFGPTGPMTTIREWHTATLLADGRVLVTGGSDGTRTLASADIFGP